MENKVQHEIDLTKQPKITEEQIEVAKNAVSKKERFRKQQMEETAFSREFKEVFVNNKRYLTKKDQLGNDVIINAPVVITVSEFERKWMNSFMLGNINGHNYFNFKEYYGITNDGRDGITVTSDDGKDILFVIDPLIGVDYTEEQLAKLRGAGRVMTNANPLSNVRSEIGKEVVEKGSDYIIGSIKDVKRKEFYELIPSWFWKERNISPRAIRNAKYIVSKYNLESEKIYLYLYNILFNLYEHKLITESSLEVLMKCTLDDFILDDDVQVIKENEVKTLPNKQSSIIEDEFLDYGEC